MGPMGAQFATRGGGAPDFLKKEKFLAGGLSSRLQEKVKGKFPENFEEAM